MFRERRARVLAALGPTAVAVLPTAPVSIRNNDVEHEFRPDSDVFYLTGLDECETVLVMAPGHPEHQVMLFVRPRNPDREIWDGPRVGIEGAVGKFGADAAFSIEELDQRLPGLLSGRSRLYYALGSDRSFDDRVLAAVRSARASARKKGDWPREIIEPGVVLHEMRWVKSEGETALMRRAVEISRDAFNRAFALARPGRSENEIEGALREVFRARGAERPAYPPIVACGANTCVLHYRANNATMKDGDLLLIDAGAEFECYASDITRTFPVNGRFSEPQRKIYQLVLDAQLAAIEAVRPGGTIEQIHRRSVEVITEGLVILGLLSGEVTTLIKDEAYKRYFMHGTSHWLGMDVHDVGRYWADGSPIPLVPGCVLTIEPGVYVSPSEERVPPEFRGIGVRIEDDVLCTAEGRTVLSYDIPKHVSELEALLAQRASI